MFGRAVPRWPLALGLVVAAGCLYPVRAKIDQDVCNLAQGPIDVEPGIPAAEPPPMPPANGEVNQAGYQKPPSSPPADTPSRPTEKGPETILPPPAAPGGGAGKPPSERTSPDEAALQALKLPPGLLPGGPLQTFPSLRYTPENEALRKELYRREFQPLPALGPDPIPVPGPEGRPLTLSDLQRLALLSSPQVKQAQAAVDAARGAAYQAGLWPNPNFGFEVDTFGTTGGPGYPGAFVDQLIKTAGKLQLARAVATLDLRNAELALKRAQTDLITRVRTGYFQVLVARESIRMWQGIIQVADHVYEIMAVQLKRGGLIAYYEPMYMRALALQARGNMVQARNAYVSSWKQLAAAMGTPGMPLTELAGSVDLPMPVFQFEPILERILRQHTEVLTAENSFAQARLNLQLARVQPIPDVDVRILVQRDYTGPPFAVAPSVAVSMPVPVWNRNQGGIRQAQANLVQQSEEPHRVRSALTTTLTLAFERYQNNRALLGMYRAYVLRDLGRVYEDTLRRYHVSPAMRAPAGPFFGPAESVALSDVVVAQGNLVAAVQSYLLYLGQMWQAIIDVTDLLQTPDLFQINGVPTECHGLLPLPCDHPCSPAPGLHQASPAWPWPQVYPGAETPRMPRADEARRRPQPPAGQDNTVTPASVPVPPEPPPDNP
jgi:cobalt-zinc-cadmium efflux system outer membrane protein